MAATSAAVLNGLASASGVDNKPTSRKIPRSTSAFMSGGARSQTLLSTPIAAKVGGASPKRFLVVVAAAATPKKSWIPAVKGGGNLLDPEWLEGS